MKSDFFRLTTNTAESLAQLCDALVCNHHLVDNPMLGALALGVSESLALEVQRWQSHYRLVDKSTSASQIFTQESLDSLVDVQLVIVNAIEVLNLSIESAQDDIKNGNIDIIDTMSRLVRVKQAQFGLLYLVNGMVHLYQQNAHPASGRILSTDTVTGSVKEGTERIQ